MPRYSYPVFDKKEICRQMSEMGAPKLSIENLISPSAEVIMPIYEFILSTESMVFSSSREESQQPCFEGLQMLGDYPDMHVDAFPMMKFFFRIKKFMKAAGAEDFSVINDLFKPESQRTIRFLSAALNYMMYRNHKVAFLGQLTAARDEEIAKLEQVSQEKLKIENDIAQIEKERIAEHPQVEALELEMKELNSRILALNKQQHGLQLDIDNLKQDDINVVDKISSVDFEIMQKQQEGASIRSQIVEKPEEVQKTLQEKKLALSEEKDIEKKASEELERWKAKTEVIRKTEKKILKLQNSLQSLEEKANDRNTDKILKERKTKLKDMEREEWAFDAQREELNFGVRRLQEHVEKNEQQITASSKDLQTLKIRREERRSDHDERHHGIVNLETQTSNLLKTASDKLVYKDNKISQLRACEDRLLAAALRYRDQLLSRAGAVDMTTDD